MTQSNKPRVLAPIVRALTDHLPSQREREIHREVLVRGRMENVVAAQFGITVAQVQHIVHRVERWLVQVQLPIPISYIHVKHLARLEHQWVEAMAAWYRSCEAEVIEKTSVETRPAQHAAADRAGDKPASGQADAALREIEKQKGERTTRSACGDVRYLEQARKVMAEIRSLSAVAGALQKQKETEDVKEISDDERAVEAGRILATVREQLAEEEIQGPAPGE